MDEYAFEGKLTWRPGVKTIGLPTVENGWSDVLDSCAPAGIEVTGGSFQAIATQPYFLSLDAAPVLVIRLGCPELLATGECVCKVGGTQENNDDLCYSVSGRDQFESLIAAICLLGSIVTEASLKHGGRLRWMGGDHTDLPTLRP
ncbi:MAG: hypothetical protein IT450_23565 [Phycisphaerales bacterium]|nr:hypothetical protein [Phycisphaerales bacterium]